MKKDKKNSFKTPEGYFEGFHERLMGKIDQTETSSETSLIPKSDGFSVPGGYFENFTQEMVAKAVEKEAKVITLKPFGKYIYAVSGIAAALLLFFSLIWNPPANVSFDDLADAEIDAYFDSTDLKLSSYEIAEVVSVDEMVLNDVLENNLDNEYLLEYLDDNINNIEELDLDIEYYE